MLLIADGLFAYVIYSIEKNPIDAIPDLSENQLIVFTEWMGCSPQVMEDQVTYPLVSTVQGIPRCKDKHLFVTQDAFTSSFQRK